MTDPTRKHHEGLPNAEVRDLLADSLRNHDVSTGFYGDARLRNHLLAQVEQAQNRLEAFDLGRGLLCIAKKFGFEEHDVSDLVSYNSESYRSFIGTKKECIERYPQIKDYD